MMRPLYALRALLHCALLASALTLEACHVARLQPQEPTCSDNAVASCESCTDRACTWCPEGPNPSDGYCCEASSRCSNPIKAASACAPIADCEKATVTTCDACLERGCAWCPGETRCHARSQDGSFPSCAGRVAGRPGCSAAPGGDT